MEIWGTVFGIRLNTFCSVVLFRGLFFDFSKRYAATVSGTILGKLIAYKKIIELVGQGPSQIYVYKCIYIYIYVNKYIYVYKYIYIYIYI